MNVKGRNLNMPTNRSLANRRPGIVASARSAVAAAARTMARNPKTVAAIAKTANAVHTKYKNKGSNKHYSKVVEGHGEITFSKFRYYRKPKNALEKKLAGSKGKITRRYLDTYRVTGTSGRQVASVFPYFEYNHLTQMVTDAFNSISGYEIGTPIDPATNIGGVGGSQSVNNLSPYMAKANHCLTLTNFENAACTVTIMDCVAKRDTSDGPEWCWLKGLQLQGESTDPGNSAAIYPVGSSPYQSKAFQETWKVQNTTQLQFRPGETHKHFIDVEPNMLVSNSRLRQINPTGVTYLGGVSRVTMVIFEGVLAGGVSSGAVTTAPISFGAMWNRTYNTYGNMQKNRINFKAVNQLPITASGSLNVTQGDGDVVLATSS